MTEPSVFWLYVLICALVSATCRLLPLAVDVERLSGGARAFIDRLGKYTSVAMLISLLAGSLQPLAGQQPSAHLWIGPVALAWLLGLTRMKSYYAFLIALGAYVLLAVR
ncbi:AzlD domain-containing protein [Pseudomonas sp. COR58]|uniref:AzlD domain-containing protein n=1 Tax=Pseudomonas ekonensis TaxID=2842353 RepID=A0ABS6PCF7_9PSED|nr:AzlD domain-containing protein [Pseudomonas ekonensis]MBV4458146.1 AzlD domain-containing protein [Pseudomonas ekonensis]